MTDFQFKFLDSYEKKDIEIFFGRSEEVDSLYNLVFETRLVLLYGATGVGKTSIIRCGLANRFEDTHWLALYIRKGDNILQSIKNYVKREIRKLDEDVPISSGILRSLKTLYLVHFKPVYLIFDQFEEIFILGDKKEQRQFFQILRNLMSSKLNVKVILSMREEYLAYLTEYEDILPNLFQNKLRIEKMRDRNLEKVVEGTIQAANIQLESKQIVDRIIENLKDAKREVELTYLQVYLDRLYKEALKTQKQPVLFDTKLLDSLKNIRNVLTVFLDERLAMIDKAIGKENSGIALNLLFRFSTREGTKKPIAISELEDFKTKYRISDENLNKSLNLLKEYRLIREQEI